MCRQRSKTPDSLWRVKKLAKLQNSHTKFIIDIANSMMRIHPGGMHIGLITDGYEPKNRKRRKTMQKLLFHCEIGKIKRKTQKALKRAADLTTGEDSTSLPKGEDSPRWNAHRTYNRWVRTNGPLSSRWHTSCL